MHVRDRFTRGFFTLAILALANLVWLGYYSYQHINRSRERQTEAINKHQAESGKFSQDIDARLGGLMAIADAIAEDLSQGRLDSTALMDRLRADVKRLDYIDGLFVAYEPHRFTDDHQYFAPLFLNRGDAGHKLVFLEYDYTINPWYYNTVAKGAGWAEPFFGNESGAVIIQYGVPFFDAEGAPMGIVAINLSPVELKQIISSSLPEGEEGFGYITSRQHTYISHPVAEKVLNQANLLQDLKKLAEDGRLRHTVAVAARERIQGGEPGWVEVTDASGRQDRVFHASVPSSGWTVLLYYLDSKDSQGYQLESRRLVWILLGGCSLVILAMLTATQFFRGGERSYWVVSIVTALVFLGGIWFVWQRALNRPPQHAGENEVLRIESQAVLTQFMEQLSVRAAQMKEEVVYVPTGVFIQHMQYSDAYNVMLSGYIWQVYDKSNRTYADGTPVSEGVIFAETEPNAEVLDIQEAYRVDLGDRQVVGWYFRVSVREEFDYRHYPFDQQTVWLRMWHTDFNRPVILVPDVASYEILNPEFLPGLEEHLVMPNWSLKGSYFDYRFNHYNTNFGVRQQSVAETRPELYFNLTIQREFLSPFITTIVPLIVVTILVFTVVMTSSKQAGELLGFSGFGVLEVCAAFFFVVIIAQIEVRDSLQVSEIIYLDYFYFVIYMMLLGVSINSILFTRVQGLRMLDFRDNLITKMAFWPIILGALLIITQTVFY